MTATVVEPVQVERGWATAELALALYAGLIPFENVAGGTSSATVLAAGLLVFTGMLAALSAKSSRRVPGSSVLLVLAPVVVAAASSAWTVDPAATTQRVLTYLSLAAVSLVMLSRPDVRAVRWALGGYVVGSAIVTTTLHSAYAARDQVDLQVRVTTAGANANDLAGMLAIAVAISLGFAVRGGRRELLVFLPLGAVCAVGCLVTASRTAAASMAVVACLAVVAGRGSWARRAALGAACFVLGSQVLARLDPRIVERLQGTAAAASVGDLNVRQDIWKVAWDPIWSRFIEGWGAGAFPRMMQVSWGYADAAHSAFFDVAGELGVLGLAAFLALVVGAVRGTAHLPPSVRTAVRFAMVALAVNASFLTWDYRKVFWLVLVAGLWGRAPTHGADGQRSSAPAGDRGWAWGPGERPGRPSS